MADASERRHKRRSRQSAARREAAAAGRAKVSDPRNSTVLLPLCPSCRTSKGRAARPAEREGYRWRATSWPSIRARHPAAPSSSTAPAAVSPARSRSSSRSFPRRARSSTIPRRSGRRSWPWREQALARARSLRRARRRHRRRQPARDDDSLGARDRPARRQRDRLAEPRHAPASATDCGQEGLEETFKRKDGSRDRSLFLGHEDQAPARLGRRPARARPPRRDPVRHRGQLPDLAADRRPAFT